nr:hypothetical protein [Leptothrix sp. C29]
MLASLPALAQHAHSPAAEAQTPPPPSFVASTAKSFAQLMDDAMAVMRIGISNGLVCEKPGKPDSALGGQPMPAWMAWNWRLGRCLVWIRPALTARLALVGP